MEFLLEKIVISKKQICVQNSKVAQMQILDEIIEIYPEKILCNMVSRIMKEMECEKIDSN